MKKSVLSLLIAAIFVFVLILVVTSGMIVQYFFLNSSGDLSSTYGSEFQKEDDSIPFCGNEFVFFTQSPIPLNFVSHIVPLGSVFPPEKVFPSQNMYFEIKSDGISRFLDVVSPGQVWITKIISDTADGSTSYELYMNPCQEVTLVFSGMYGLDESLKAKIEESNDCTIYHSEGVIHKKCEADSFIQIFQGQVIGSFLGVGKQHGFEVSVFDTRFENMVLLNPFRFDFSKNGEPTCPLSYFHSDVRSRYIQLIQGFNTSEEALSSEASLCGVLSYDVSDTLQGLWFRKGVNDNFPEDPHVALIYDSVNPNIGIFSIGSSIDGVEPRAYRFIANLPEPDEKSNVRFSDTKPGTLYCYELVDSNGRSFVMIAEIVGKNTLQIEKMNTRRCSGNEVFFEAATFVR